MLEQPCPCELAQTGALQSWNGCCVKATPDARTWSGKEKSKRAICCGRYESIKQTTAVVSVPALATSETCDTEKYTGFDMAILTDMPALSMLVRVSTSFDTGPMVHTTFVDTGPLVWSSCNHPHCSSAVEAHVAAVLDAKHRLAQSAARIQACFNRDTDLKQ